MISSESQGKVGDVNISGRISVFCKDVDSVSYTHLTLPTICSV